MTDLALSISDKMRTAAKAVALSHTQFMQSCHGLSALKGDEAGMAASLKKRKDAHTAYHIALKFLRTATLKANPQFNELEGDTLQQKIEAWMDGQLNRLIIEEMVEHDPSDDTIHRVMRAEEEVRWS